MARWQDARFRRSACAALVAADLAERVRASVAAKLVELASAVAGDDQLDFIDRFNELDALEEWIDAEVEVDKALGYPR